MMEEEAELLAPDNPGESESEARLAGNVTEIPNTA